MSSVRRSSRARKQVVDPYQNELNLRVSKKVAAKKKEDSEADSESGSDDHDSVQGKASPKQVPMTKETSDSSDDDDDDDDDDDEGSYEEAGKTKAKTKSPEAVKKQKVPPKKVSTSKAGIDNKHKTKQSTTTGNRKAPQNKGGPKMSLNYVAKKALEDSETPETSLVAALLGACNTIDGGRNAVAASSSTSRAIVKERQAVPNTMYTPELEAIARLLVQQHSVPMQLHIQLLNLVFRSVGGSLETNLDLDVDLEALDDSEWNSVLTEVVTAMAETDDDCTLLCANPAGPIVSSKLVARGQQEYRSIYEEFWFRLGDVILTGTATSSNGNAGGSSRKRSKKDDDDSGSSSDNDGDEGASRTPYSSSRFDLELVRDLLVRLTEVTPVGQPDLRMGAVIAVLQLSLACLERSVDLEAKMEAATRQYAAASKANMRSRMQGLKVTMEGWKRQKVDLEAMVQGVFTGVLMHRYRDSDPYIRTFSLQSLSKMCLLRPDLFLVDKFLKYFAWMCSDKDAGVRVAGLSALLAPFQEVKKGNGKTISGTKRLTSLQIDLSCMHNACIKFLPRIVDCTLDSQIRVQEVAVELMLTMLRNKVLDEWEDDDGWEQVNLRALDSKTSPKVRRDALYFIAEQLESFFAMDVSPSEDTQVQRLDSLASWVANKLCDGALPIDNIRVHLTDYLIQSLREMPEHKCLATNWSAMIKAIRFENSSRGNENGRQEVARQRVLLRMLACGAKLEIGTGDAGVVERSDISSVIGSTSTGSKRKRGSTNTSQPQEKLALILLKSLPGLLGAFNTDVMALRSITALPAYLIPSVFSLPSRKAEFQNVIKSLCATFCECTDERVLQNIARALSELVQGGHARVSEVKLQVKRLSISLQDRLMELLFRSEEKKPSKSPRSSKGRSTRGSNASGSTLSSKGMLSDATSPAVDVENSIYLCLLRLRVLAKKCSPVFLFDDEDEGDHQAEGFCNTITEAIAKRLQDRKPILDENEEQGTDDDMQTAASTRIPAIWAKEDPNVHAVVARSVDEALHILTLLTAWKLMDALNLHDDSDKVADSDMGVEEGDLVVLGMRNRLTRLLGFCFDQFLDKNEDDVSDEHLEFSATVQASAGRFASDLRVLFPRDWASAADPIRRKLALTDDTQLIGGFMRYLGSRSEELYAFSNKKHKATAGEDVALVNDLLLPEARALVANWNDGNRREAAKVLVHIDGSGEKATQLVQNVARVLRKINPARLLEAQMACLYITFDKWLDSEPDALDDDRPTEEQVQEYEEAFHRHTDMFKDIEKKARRLSIALGVGKFADKNLSDKILPFMQEGIRYAFQGNQGVEDNLILGSRLPFLTVLSSYSVWIKRNKAQLAQVRASLDERTEELKEHPEFDDVHENDLSAIDRFRESLGLKPVEERSVVSPANSNEDDQSDGSQSRSISPMVTPKDTNKRRMARSSMSSQRSRLSAQSNSLSPLMEETPIGEEAPSTGESVSDRDSVSEKDVDESPRPKQRRKTSGSNKNNKSGGSLGSRSTRSKMDASQSMIEEAEEEESIGSSDSE